ncbi:MAG: HaeII family restriction endonuclease [Bacteroidales bacterium]|nr:HaeII family restriction endonuclease [Bacteroidales bacterium]
MKKPTVIAAKEALDKLINKSRVHLYKPIQIAEILHYHRVHKDIDLLKLEDYRKSSKKWRDAMCLLLLGRICTSSAKFQDNLFEANAIPPEILNVLGEANCKTNGGVEAYIYNNFTAKHNQLSNALNYCLNATPETFYVKSFIDSFWTEAGLKRSLDKIYEIIVYSLFTTLVEATNLKVEIFIDEKSLPLINEFADFSQKVMCLDVTHTKHIQAAAVYRVGVTNAADRGLDMYSNWGPAIQIKHLSLDIELAQNIVDSVSSDKIVIVCKDAEKDVINTILSQIGWGQRVQSIITESDLILWYEKALRGKYSNILAKPLLNSLAEEISLEFPSIEELPESLKKRRYDKVNERFWL